MFFMFAAPNSFLFYCACTTVCQNGFPLKPSDPLIIPNDSLSPPPKSHDPLIISTCGCLLSPDPTTAARDPLIKNSLKKQSETERPFAVPTLRFFRAMCETTIIHVRAHSLTTTGS